ncbi:MAG: disulfide bond formation protein B [Thiomonas sp.]|uniref:disulfide bond formation protein B n=1 Tax=Thiomonas sp. TaxID=2047785 RepID=UPI002A36FF2D|nr:disulfide bond formation protein B [Thiomonas sp.]MDY0329867.1 disulfide bond formation protein B [Thiomonas sp.]
MTIRHTCALPCVAAATALGALGGALWLQRRGFAPCPLCILQRMAYLGVLVFALSAIGLMRPQMQSNRQLAARVVLGFGVLSGLAGLGLAARHIWLVLHPGQLCGLDPLAAVINHWAVTQWAPWMFRADGLCADTPSVFGLALPFWSAAGFILTSALLLAALLRRAPSSTR